MLARTIFRTATHLRRPISTPIIITPHQCYFSTLKKYKQSQKLHRGPQSPNISSLHSDQLQQLSKLSHYSTSISHLQKNQIQKSYTYLQYSLTESKANFPQSINLQMFIKNRMSILQKILNKNQQFVKSLQDIFFICLSLKGQRALDTIKNLHNYMTALVMYDQDKLNLVVEYLSQNNFMFLLKKSEYFVGINRFVNGDRQQAINQIQGYCKNKQDKNKNLIMNNLCWFRILQITHGNLEIVPQEKHEQLNLIADQLIKCILQAEKQGQLKTDTAEVQKNLQMTGILSQYLDNKKSLLLRIKPSTLLLNSYSPILMSNLAHVLYFLQKHEQSSLLMRIALQTSIQLHQPYRLGLGLILLAKINNRLKLPYQDILIDIIENRGRYTDAVVREALITYSRFLWRQMRYYEAEAYVVQAEELETRGKASLQLEGIVLPDFDFEF